MVQIGLPSTLEAGTVWVDGDAVTMPFKVRVRARARVRVGARVRVSVRVRVRVGVRVKVRVRVRVKVRVRVCGWKRHIDSVACLFPMEN